ncbi:hypothetical protein SADUNF_Sadunf16G0118900 [Salix dunnii]|uniref:Uncharacterized protein n=1 Tax=Salix dunnii TaxID=1413687 RepID=A0A835J6B9_9ROSI|nr:hypothetical protein SADUNF_Sadunf16G0118900 [Salix dunnii]
MASRSLWNRYVVERPPDSLYIPIRLKEDHNDVDEKYSQSLISYDPETKKSRAVYQIGDRRVFLYTPCHVPLEDVLIGGGCCKILTGSDLRSASYLNQIQ